MEMVSMVLQEQFRNNRILILLTILVLGCTNKKIPELLKMDAEGLEKIKGVYYYESVPYSGAIYTLFETGDTATYSEMKLGIKEGVSRKWWPGGQLKFCACYSRGLYHGEVAEWYENGIPSTCFNYNRGQEKGLQQAWKPDGSIKANYEVIGDRKYGLTGIKNCSNVLEN